MGEVKKVGTTLIDQIFDNLDKWRHLPAYQLERRADIFFSLYLNDVLKKYRSVSSEVVIIPEFPVRIGTITKDTKSNQSFKIDYVVVDNKKSKVYFIELKTDNKSIRPEQNKYLKYAEKQGINTLIDGILLITKTSKEKRKYRQLNSLLLKVGLISSDNMPTIKKYEVEILYILPKNAENRRDVIDFKHFAEIVRQQDDFLSRRFARSLDLWAEKVAGEN